MHNNSSVSGYGNSYFAAPAASASAAEVTAALQAAIDATPEFGTLVLPWNTEIKISSTLTITKNMAIRGQGVYCLTGAYGTNGQFDGPAYSPYLGGTVITVQSAAIDAINITGSAVRVDLSDFGIRFDASRFINTGHGIKAQSSATYLSGSEHGLFHSEWNNIQVFGHDGNHYAFNLVNELLCTLRDLRSYGGGGLRVACDSYAGNYGNLLVDHQYVSIFCNGTAHGYSLEGRVGSGTAGVLNLIQFNRPQANGQSLVAKFPTSTAPTTSQYLFRANNPVSVQHFSLIAPDFESPSIGLPIAFGSAPKFIDPSGIYGKGSDTASNTFDFLRGPLSTRTINSRMQIKGGDGTSPSVAPLAAAGNTATTTLTAGATDSMGKMTITTNGTGRLANSSVARFTWSSLTGAYGVLLFPIGQYSAAMGMFVQNVNATGFDVGFTAVGAGPGGYDLYYQVMT